MKNFLKPVAAATLFALPAFAQEGINVTGVGRADAKVTRLEIMGVVHGKAELAGDAMVKFKDTKRRGLEVLEELKIDKLSVKQEGVGVSQVGGMDANTARMLGQQGGANQTPQVTLNERLTIVLDGVDALSDAERVDLVAKILDAATDASISVGAEPLNYYQVQSRGGKTPEVVRFVVPDAEETINAATDLAIADARSQAEMVAKLSGVKLGKVLSVKVTHVPPGTSVRTTTSSAAAAYYAARARAAGEKERFRLQSSVYKDIPVVVHANMTFEIIE